MEEPKRGGPGRVLGTFLLLALLLAGLVFLGQGLFVSPVDGEAKQREYFGDRPLPFGLALAEAARLLTGDVLVRFARAESAAGEPRQPLELVLIEYRSRSAVEPLFRPAAQEGPPGVTGGGASEASARLVEWERDPSFAWNTTMKRGEIAWGAWSSKLLIQREFSKGGGWSEEARVDLSRGERALVLFAHWPPGTPADEDALRELLLAIEVSG